MLPTPRQILKWVNYFCVGQFVLILLGVLILSRPLTESSKMMVGASAIFGLLFSGMVRRNLQIRKEIMDKKKQYQELEENLKRIRDEKDN